MEELIRKNIMAIFFGIILTGLISGIGMVFTGNTKNAVFEAQFGFLKSTMETLTTQVKSLETEVRKSSQNSWSKADQAAHIIEYQYLKDNSLRVYEKLEERVRLLEQKK